MSRPRQNNDPLSQMSSVGLMTALSEALAEYGLLTRSGFLWSEDEDPHGVALTEVCRSPTGTLVLIGNAGPDFWLSFDKAKNSGADPMNAWTKFVIDPIATSFSATALYPFDVPHWPFQQWALRTGTVFPSPLGLLIHPDYGLWHAYRAALVFDQKIDLPDAKSEKSPCASCDGQPCLTTCPVGAFSSEGYDVPACADHLKQNPQGDCMEEGCRARRACPIGRRFTYSKPQSAFHMAAFARAISG